MTIINMGNCILQLSLNFFVDFWNAFLHWDRKAGWYAFGVKNIQTYFKRFIDYRVA